MGKLQSLIKKLPVYLTARQIAGYSGLHLSTVYEAITDNPDYIKHKSTGRRQRFKITQDNADIFFDLDLIVEKEEKKVTSVKDFPKRKKVALKASQVARVTGMSYQKAIYRLNHLEGIESKGKGRSKVFFFNQASLTDFRDYKRPKKEKTVRTKRKEHNSIDEIGKKPEPVLMTSLEKILGEKSFRIRPALKELGIEQVARGAYSLNRKETQTLSEMLKPKPTIRSFDDPLLDQGPVDVPLKTVAKIMKSAPYSARIILKHAKAEVSGRGRGRTYTLDKELIERIEFLQSLKTRYKSWSQVDLENGSFMSIPNINKLLKKNVTQRIKELKTEVIKVGKTRYFKITGYDKSVLESGQEYKQSEWRKHSRRKKSKDPGKGSLLQDMDLGDGIEMTVRRIADLSGLSPIKVNKVVDTYHIPYKFSGTSALYVIDNENKHHFSSQRMSYIPIFTVLEEAKKRKPSFTEAKLMKTIKANNVAMYDKAIKGVQFPHVSSRDRTKILKAVG